MTGAIRAMPLAVLMICLVVRAMYGAFAGATITLERKKGARV